MTASTYGGESNAKKIARAMFWDWKRRSLVGAGFDLSRTRTAVLCGPHGFDARAAQTQGFRNIWCIDADPSYIEQAKAESAEWGNKPQGVRWIARDFFEVINETQFDVVFFDGCGQLLKYAESLAENLVSIAAGQRHLSLTIGGCYGRDGGSGGATQRCRTASSRLVEIASNKGLGIKPGGAFSYSSRRYRDDGSVNPGSPMIYLSASLCDAERGCDRQTRRALKRIAKRHTKKRGLDVYALGSDLSGDALRAAVLENREIISGGAKGLAEMFCLDWRQVAAWLAVDTKGKNAAEAAE